MTTPTSTPNATPTATATATSTATPTANPTAAPNPTATATSTWLHDPRLTSALALLATAVWLGGLLALGAIVAPIVFTMIPRPEAADAMTMVFARFDVVAVGCVALILATEAWRATAKRPIGKLDVARMVTAALGSTLVLLEALWITPAIVALHRGGAVRGLGAAGLELDRIHGLAEACGKTQAAFALALVALHVVTLAPRDPSPHPSPASGRGGRHATN